VGREPAISRLDWALNHDEGDAAVTIAAALYLIGAALTATAWIDPHLSSPLAVAAVAVVACATAAGLLLTAREGRGTLWIAAIADLWGIVLIAVLCAATGGAESPLALIYFFAICHAAAFQPPGRFAFIALVGLAAFLLPLAYGDVSSSFAPFAVVGIVLALLVAVVIHLAMQRIRSQRRRLQFMIAASAKLDASLDPSRTLRRMAASAVPELAELCIIDLVDRDTWVETVAAGVDPALAQRIEALRREQPLDLTGAHPVARALATGRPQIVEDLTTRDALDQVAQSVEHLRFMQDAGYRCAAVFPLTARHRTHGVMSFLHVANGASYSASEIAVLEDLTARAALAYDNARLYAERTHVASALQRSLLPSALPDIPWLGLASYFRPSGPANRVGGDFYDAFRDGDRCWLVVGDVCGKGPEAAAVTGLLRQSTRAYARSSSSPAAVLAHVNHAMLDQDFGGGYATAVLVLLELRGDHVDATVAAAGHPPAVVVRSGGEVEELGRGALLGVFPSARVEDVRTPLRQGDALALYTDGLSEARAPRRFVSVQEMTAPLRRSSPATAEHVVDALLKPVAPDEDVRDDIAILAALARPVPGEKAEPRAIRAA
jgi:serine phosphatase RsbU (regulator of sigma subunit)